MCRDTDLKLWNNTDMASENRATCGRRSQVCMCVEEGGEGEGGGYVSMIW